MAPLQATLYNWVKQTGTLRQDPDGPSTGKARRAYATLNNKCMELRKVSRHRFLFYFYLFGGGRK